MSLTLIEGTLFFTSPDFPSTCARIHSCVLFLFYFMPFLFLCTSLWYFIVFGSQNLVERKDPTIWRGTSKPPQPQPPPSPTSSKPQPPCLSLVSLSLLNTAFFWAELISCYSNPHLVSLSISDFFPHFILYLCLAFEIIKYMWKELACIW
jgi:hypothetical protein